MEHVDVLTTRWRYPGTRRAAEEQSAVTSVAGLLHCPTSARLAVAGLHRSAVFAHVAGSPWGIWNSGGDAASRDAASFVDGAERGAAATGAGRHRVVAVEATRTLRIVGTDSGVTRIAPVADTAPIAQPGQWRHLVQAA
jgi:hypothetical protein